LAVVVGITKTLTPPLQKATKILLYGASPSIQNTYWIRILISLFWIRHF
jgi:hypothetical protein